MNFIRMLILIVSFSIVSPTLSPMQWLLKKVGLAEQQCLFDQNIAKRCEDRICKDCSHDEMIAYFSSCSCSQKNCPKSGILVKKANGNKFLDLQKQDPIYFDDFKKGDQVVILNCGHAFIKQTIIEWFTGKSSYSCPTCKNSLGSGSDFRDADWFVNTRLINFSIPDSENSLVQLYGPIECFHKKCCSIVQKQIQRDNNRFCQACFDKADIAYSLNHSCSQDNCPKFGVLTKKANKKLFLSDQEVFNKNDQVIILECGHAFLKEFIIEWFTGKPIYSCPTCKKSFGSVGLIIDVDFFVNICSINFSISDSESSCKQLYGPIECLHRKKDRIKKEKEKSSLVGSFKNAIKKIASSLSLKSCNNEANSCEKQDFIGKLTVESCTGILGTNSIIAHYYEDQESNKPAFSSQTDYYFQFIPVELYVFLTINDNQEKKISFVTAYHFEDLFQRIKDLGLSIIPGVTFIGEVPQDYVTSKTCRFFQSKIPMVSAAELFKDELQSDVETEVITETTSTTRIT